MKIKRYEFGVNVLVLILFALTAAVSLISAYGAACVAWDVSYWGRAVPAPGPPFPPGYIMTYMFNYMVVFGPLFQVLNVVTWITSLITAFLIFAYLTGFLGKWIWYVALLNALIAFLAGLIPALIADTNGFTFLEWEAGSFMAPVQAWVPFIYEGIGSPHWAKTIANATVLAVLAIVIFFDLIKVTNFKSFTEKDNRFSGNVGRQLMLVSFILLWLSAVSFLGTGFMADAHIVGGINVWELIEIQSLGGYITLFGGASTLSAGLIYNKIKPPIRTLVK